MNLQTVRTWSQTTVSQTSLLTALQQAFDHVDIFAEIYLPIKTSSSTGQSPDYTYENIGIMPDDIASIYAELYGSNYLIDDFTTPSVAASKLANRIQAVMHMYREKYLKLIEMQGFAWNPMWNVDGKTLEESLHVITDNINEKYNKGTTTTRTPTIGEKTSFDNYKVTDTLTRKGQIAEYDDDTTMNKHGTAGNPSTGDEITREYIPKSRHISDYTKATDTTDHKYDGTKQLRMDGKDETKVRGADTKTGTNMTSDNFTNTVTRQGNIGVTKTTELIDSARKTLRWSILNEFFEDINKQILIGIYD